MPAPKSLEPVIVKPKPPISWVKAGVENTVDYITILEPGLNYRGLRVVEIV
jgi:hypothetical protein